MISLAALSTVAGYQVARIEIPGAHWFHNKTLLAPASTQALGLVPASNPGVMNADLEAISHLAPQQQAERLVRTLDGTIEKGLGLLLGRQVADGFQVGVHNAGIGRGHEAVGLGRSGR